MYEKWINGGKKSGFIQAGIGVKERSYICDTNVIFGMLL